MFSSIVSPVLKRCSTCGALLDGAPAQLSKEVRQDKTRETSNIALFPILYPLTFAGSLMKPIQNAVTLIALTGACELSRVDSVLSYIPKSHLEQLDIQPVKKEASLFEEGVKKQEQEDYLGAIADYTQFLETHPNRIEAYTNRGFSKAMLNDLPGAIDDFDRAIELEPHNADAYNARGNVHAMAGQLGASIRDFNRAIRCDRNFADAYYNRAIGRHDLGDRYGAKLDFDRAAKLFQQQKDLGGYHQAREWIIKLK
jgi:tetratricopeptide (TPR) repeat protein